MADASEDRMPDSGPVGPYIAHLEAYREAAKKWEKHADRIAKRYRSEAKGTSSVDLDSTGAQFNILWANTQIVAPALFSDIPVPVVKRRHQDQDPIARIASDMLQQGLMTDMERDDWYDVLERATLDQILVGRGVPWLRYDATYADEQTVDDAGEPMLDDKGEPVMHQKVVDERSPIEYVPRMNFAHAPKKTWQEVVENGWVARMVPMTKAQVVERFGEEFADIPMSTKSGDKDKEQPDQLQYADVWELWDASDKKVVWFCEGYREKLLDETDDPLELVGFFPCPKPIYAGLDNDSLLPVPEFVQIEALADEVDDLTNKIDILLPVLRLAGIYDQSVGDIGKLFDPNNINRNVLIGVQGLDELQADGSTRRTLEGVMQWLPMAEASQVLTALYDTRQRTIEAIREISGVSDTMRGETDPRKKLGQSRLEAQSGSQRLQRKRRAVETGARDSIRIKAEIMVEQYDPQRFRHLCGFDYMPEIVAMSQEAPELVEIVFERAMEMLRNDRLRDFRLDIETDSTIVADQDADQERRSEFLTAMGGFMTNALPIIQAVPQMAPLVVQMMLFTARSFRTGSTLEFEFEKFAQQVTQIAGEAGPPGVEPPPEEAEAAAAAQPTPEQVATDQTALQMAQQQLATSQAKGANEVRASEAKAVAAEAKAEQAVVALQAEIAKLQERLAAVEAASAAPAGISGLARGPN